MKRRTVLILCVLAALLLSGCAAQGSIGVIGGADGPTAIIIAGPDE